MKKPTKSTTDDVIADSTWSGDQSCHRQLIVKRGGDVLRYHVRRNAYVSQSFAEVELWRDGWQKLHRMPGELMTTDASYVVHNISPSAFDGDISELRRVACAVLSAKGKV